MVTRAVKEQAEEYETRTENNIDFSVVGGNVSVFLPSGKNKTAPVLTLLHNLSCFRALCSSAAKESSLFL
uniref:Uncharacterized protein n=1 Tax=Fundulus heteroclitus TaxID=8078 RepID=A0A3Q2QH31_FUNHE